MIENISINNYALIDHTHIELEKGFSSPVRLVPESLFYWEQSV